VSDQLERALPQALCVVRIERVGGDAAGAETAALAELLGLATVLEVATRDAVEQWRGRNQHGRQGVFARLLQAGVDAGTLRADVDAEDVFRATGSVFLLPQEDGWREQAARLLRLILDGLRYRAREGD
jgi:hypothetical protein